MQTEPDEIQISDSMFEGLLALTKHIVAFAERYILHYDIDDAQYRHNTTSGSNVQMMFHLAWISYLLDCNPDRILLYHGYNVLYRGEPILTKYHFCGIFLLLWYKP